MTALVRLCILGVIAVTTVGVAYSVFAVYHGHLYWVAGVPLFPMLGAATVISIYERWER